MMTIQLDPTLHAREALVQLAAELDVVAREKFEEGVHLQARAERLHQDASALRERARSHREVAEGLAG